MATINDVAKKAGVSRATVSRVLNDHPFVDEDKRRRVREAMKHLGYEPSQIAQQLRLRKTHTIAVIISRVSNPFFGQLVAGMESAAADHSYQLILCQTQDLKQKEWNYLQLLKRKQVDGIITTSINHTYEQLQTVLKFGPVVFCSDYADMNIPSVRVDNEQASYEATRHLLELGHRNIACGLGIKANLNADREAGYRRAMKEYGADVDEDWILRDLVFLSDGQTALKQFMVGCRRRPTAVFVGSDEVAVGMIKAAKAIGLSVPGELAVVGFDDQLIAEIVEPRLTTVHQPTFQMGKKAMETVIQLLESETPVPPQKIVLPTYLVVRESTVSQGT